MNRKLKALGLALVAALALTAVMASAASAQFTSSNSHTIISGSQEGSHEFTAGEGFGGVTCTTATFSGTGSSTNDADQTIIPTYSGCKDTFGRIVHVDNSGLKYTYTADGTVHISGGMTWTVTSGSAVVCTIVFKDDQTYDGIGYHNLGSTEPGANTQGITLTTATIDISTTTSGGFFNCGVTNGEHNGGTYWGTTLLTGKDTSGNAVAISVHGPTEP